MNIPESKRYWVTALALVIFTASAGMPLPAGKRRGATVEVTLADGSRVRGELLAVKSDVLLVYDRTADQGKSLDLRQVARVKEFGKPRFLTGITIGICAGLAISIYNLKKVDNESLMPLFEIVSSFLPLPVAGLGGGLLGALGGIPKKYSLAGVAPQIVRKNLERLARHAREPYFEKPAVD